MGPAGWGVGGFGGGGDGFVDSFHGHAAREDLEGGFGLRFGGVLGELLVEFRGFSAGDYFDHIGAVAPIARVTGATVYCPELESHVLADIMTYIPYEGIGPFESWEAEEFVGGGERLELAGFEIEVFFTPGHSPGHVTSAFCDPDDVDGGYVIASGDVLFQGSVGRTDLPGADHAELMRSLAMLADSFADETTVLPGHMGITTIGHERATNQFMQDLPSVS